MNIVDAVIVVISLLLVTTAINTTLYFDHDNNDALPYNMT
jgi:hypothetical protein